MNFKINAQQILILGGSGHVGRHLFKRLSSGRALATYCHRPFAGGVYFNSLSMKLSDILAVPSAFSHAVILFGETNPDLCASDLQKSRDLNVISTQSILDELRSLKIKPIFFSSEFVFDGTRGNYTERDVPNPVLTYGRQKIEIEKYLARHFKEYLVLRLAKTFTAERGDGTLLTAWFEAIEKGEVIRCAHDQVFSPIYVDDVVEAVCQLIQLNCTGIFHLSGRCPWSRIKLLQLLLGQMKSYHFPLPRVIPCSIHDFNLVEKRPLNVSMEPDKLVQAIGLQIQDVGAVCRKIVQMRYAKA